MEKLPPEVQNHSFLDRLRTVYTHGTSEDPIRRVPELDPMDDIRMRIADLSPLEAYLRLIERTDAFQHEERERSAVNIRIYCEKLAQHLIRKRLEASDKDISTLQFVDESLLLLHEKRPELANDVALFIQFAEDTVKFDDDL